MRTTQMVQSLPPSRPVDQSDRDELLIPVLSGIQELLFAPVNPFNDRPGFVAGPPAETGLGRAVQDLTRLNCRLWASRDKSGYSPRVNQYNGEVCGPYLDSLDENPEGGFIGAPFQGGQCDDVYTVNYTLDSDNPGQTTGFLQARGPVLGIIVKDLGTGAFGIFLQASGVVISGSPNCRSVPNTGAGDYFIGGGGSDGDVRPTINSITPCGVDNCGDPAPVVQPPGTVTPVTPIVPTINIDLPGVGPVTINVDIGPTGNPIICAPDVDVCVEVNPEFGDSEGGGGGDGGPPPGDVGQPGDAEDTGSGGSDDGEAPPGSVLTGLKIDVLESPAEARQFTPGVFRAACYIYMGTEAGLDQDFAGAMLATGQFVFAEKDNLTKWRVDANLGFNLRITPYYREVEG